MSCLSCARLQEECGVCAQERPTIPTAKLARILERRQAVQGEERGEAEQDAGGEVEGADDPREQSDAEEEHEEVI